MALNSVFRCPNLGMEWTLQTSTQPVLRSTVPYSLQSLLISHQWFKATQAESEGWESHAAETWAWGLSLSGSWVALAES